MRIAHVVRRISFDDWGGTEQVVWNLAKAQKAAGHEVRLFATTALWKGLVATKDTKVTKKALYSMCPLCPLWQKNKPYEETVEGIEILRFKPIYPWWPMPKGLVDELDRKGGNPFVPGLGRALQEWKPDVIHCHAMARIAELCLRVGEEGRGKGEKGTGNSKLPTNDYRLPTNDYPYRLPDCRLSARDLETPRREACLQLPLDRHDGGDGAHRGQLDELGFDVEQEAHRPLHPPPR